MLALTPKDIDLISGLIIVSKTYYRSEGKDIISTPKTDTSNRTIMIPEFLVEEIRTYISQHYGLPQDERLFPIVARTLQKRMSGLMEKAGVKKIRIHDFRYPNQNKIQTFMVKAVCTLFFLSIKVWILFLLLRFSKSAEFN